MLARSTMALALVSAAVGCGAQPSLSGMGAPQGTTDAGEGGSDEPAAAQSEGPVAPERSGAGPLLAVDDAYEVVAGERLVVGAAQGVLRNDAFARAVSGLAPTSAVRGVAALAPDGAFEYQPPARFGGCDTFSYDVQGDDGTYARAVVRVWVHHPDFAPSPISLPVEATVRGNEGDRLGTAMAALPDFNGNGRVDLAVGSPRPVAGSGTPGIVSVGALEIRGMSPRGEAGSVLAWAGDVNGDGRSDLLVGAPKSNVGGGAMGDLVGRAFVVFGTPQAAPIDLAAVHAGQGGFSITGAMMADFAGAALATVGDWSDDGRAEVAVGVPRNDVAGEDAGAVAVVWGKGGGAPVDFAPLGSDGLWIFGETAGDHAGESVAAVGDLDANGAMDLVVAAPNASRAYDGQGVVYVVFGPLDTHVGLQEMAAGVGGFAIWGTESQQRLGTVVAAVGDVDGEGTPDFAIGEPGWSQGRGRVLVVTGGAPGISPQDVIDGAAGFVVVGEEGDGGAGMSLAAAGDINGDGRDDLWVGAPRSEGGRVYLVHGPTGSGPVALADVAQGVGGYRIDAVAPNGLTASALAGGMDLSGDGAVDLAIGAPGVGAPGPYAGAVWVVDAAPGPCSAGGATPRFGAPR